MRLDGHAQLARRRVAGDDRVGVDRAKRDGGRRFGGQRDRRQNERGENGSQAAHGGTPDSTIPADDRKGPGVTAVHDIGLT